MRISVVVPHFNAYGDLSRCLQALLCQQFAALEILVVDDGSPDRNELERVIRSTRNQRVRCLRVEHGGPAAARNAGAIAASGDWVAFTDADCVPDGDWLESIARAAKDSDVVYGRVYSNPGYLFPMWVAPSDFAFITANVAIKRETFLKIGKFRGDFPVPFREDTEFGIRATLSGARVCCMLGGRVFHPLRKQGLRKVVTIGLWHKYDVKLFGEYGYRVAAEIGGIWSRPLYPTGISVFGGATLATALLSLYLGLTQRIALAPLPLAVVYLAIFLNAFRSKGRPSIRERGENAALAAIYSAAWFVGRVQGSLEYRRLCL